MRICIRSSTIPDNDLERLRGRRTRPQASSNVALRRDNQLGNSVNLDGSVARGVTEGGRSPTGGT
ncbi:hypothetical protein CN152_36210, partial [Sinorhizobium meliloti]